MPKGKKTKKTKKSTKEKPPEEEKQTINEIPKYMDPKIFTPIVDLTVRLATPMVDALTFKLQVRTTTRLEEIKRKIIERHDGAISNVYMCIHKYAPSDILDENKTLQEVGVIAAGQQTLIYEFDPVSYPLLTTPIGRGVNFGK